MLELLAAAGDVARRRLDHELDALVHLLPRLRGQLRGIASVLDEREREDTFRLKKIKGKKAQQKRAANERKRLATEAENAPASEPVASAPAYTAPAPEPVQAPAPTPEYTEE